MKRAIPLISMIFLFAMLTPAFAYNMTVDATLNPYYTNIIQYDLLSNETSYSDGGINYDIIAKTGAVSQAWVLNSYFPQSPNFDLYQTKNESSLWINFPYPHIIQIDFDLDIRYFNAGAINTLLILQTSHGEEDAGGYREWMRSQIITNITELGIGQHHLSYYGSQITITNGSTYGCSTYNIDEGTIRYVTCPEDFNFNGNLNTIWMALMSRFPTEDAQINITIGNLTYTVDNLYEDGICQPDESSIPYDWNYDSSCRFGGLTGYASAVGVQQAQTLMVIAGAVLILGSIASLVLMDLTLIGILSAVIGLAFGLGIILVSLSIIIVP